MPARHRTAIGTQNPVLILLREASLLDLTNGSVIGTWGEILPHNWVPYDVFSARKEQVPGGISPE